MYEFAIKNTDGDYQTVFTGSLEDGVVHMVLHYPELPDRIEVQITELGKMN